MITYDLSRFTLEDIHTQHHNKNEMNRSPEIEGYIRQVNDWLSNYIDLKDKRVVDVGCDYGYQLYDLINRYNINPNSYGVDIYPHDVLEGVEVRLCEEDKALSMIGIQTDLITYNHTLEHFRHPWRYIPKKVKEGLYIYIGLPKHGTEWATWNGHVSTWDINSLTDFMKSFGYELKASNEVCFRENNVEIWGLFA